MTSPLSYRTVLVMLGCWVVTVCGWGGAPAVAGPQKAGVGDRPNIIYINIDDLGWADLGYTGSRYYETPNIDGLARRGMVFTQAYAPASNCQPSRACCMTGRYTPRHGVYTVGSSERGDARLRKLIPVTNRTVLPDDELTIAELLHQAGYTTIHLGKWHLGPDPRTQGFDINIGGNTAGHPRSYFSPYHNPDLPDGPKGEHLPVRLTDQAIRFLQDHTDRPFFMYLAYYSVHTPLQAPAETIAKYRAKPPAPGQSNPTYAAMIEHMDRNVGRLLQALDRLQLTARTFVLFTSDNGGVAKISSQAPLRAGKGAYYEGGIREPLIICWPGHVQPGSRCDVPVHGVDFFPTLAEVAGVKIPADKVCDGLSLVPLLTGRGQLPQRPLFWHFPIYLQNYGSNEGNRDPLFRTRPGSVIRLGRWKLHEYFEDGGLELYDLQADPGEQHDLAGQMPQKVQQMHQMLVQWRQKVHAPVPTRPNPKYDPAYEKRMLAKYASAGQAGDRGGNTPGRPGRSGP